MSLGYRRTGRAWAGAALLTGILLLATGAGPAAHPQPLKLTRGLPQHVGRYIGTIGGQAVTVELRWQQPDSVTGSFYFHRRGAVYGLTYQKPRAKAKALTLAADDRHT
jgi:hypothetical protein